MILSDRGRITQPLMTTKGILKGDGGSKNSSKTARLLKMLIIHTDRCTFCQLLNYRIQWDEENVTLTGAERGTRMKIDEPKTPYITHNADKMSVDGSRHSHLMCRNYGRPGFEWAVVRLLSHPIPRRTSLQIACRIRHVQLWFGKVRIVGHRLRFHPRYLHGNWLFAEDSQIHTHVGGFEARRRLHYKMKEKHKPSALPPSTCVPTTNTTTTSPSDN